MVVGVPCGTGGSTSRSSGPRETGVSSTIGGAVGWARRLHSSTVVAAARRGLRWFEALLLGWAGQRWTSWDTTLDVNAVDIAVFSGMVRRRRSRCLPAVLFPATSSLMCWWVGAGTTEAHRQQAIRGDRANVICAAPSADGGYADQHRSANCSRSQAMQRRLTR